MPRRKSQHPIAALGRRDPDYVLALNLNNPLTRVRMAHWMTLQPDRKTMLNVVTVRKWGIVLAWMTEAFQQASPPPDVP